MPITQDFACSLAEELATIPDFPRSDGAVRAVAKHLRSLCETEEQGEWLVNEAQLRWESWRGPKGLAQMLFDHLNPELPPPNAYRQMPPPEAPECELCGDWGHRDDPKTKLRIWCQCEMGKWQESRHPGLVEALNRNKSRSSAFSAPMTKAERNASPEWLKQI